jgi:hypothetical protein
MQTDVLLKIFTSNFLLIAILMCLLFAFTMIQYFFKHANLSYSVDETINQYLNAMAKGRIEQAWNFLSPSLQEALTDLRRKTIATSQVIGIDYLACFQHDHTTAFVRGVAQIGKTRRVATNTSEEMIMVNARSHPEAPSMTLWLTREIQLSAHWRVEELMIHPNSGNNYQTLSGKRMSSQSVADSNAVASKTPNYPMPPLSH